jgi:hypothetical protein
LQLLGASYTARVVLCKNKNQVTVIIPTLVFIKLSEAIFRARTTEMDYYHSIQDNYASYNKSHHPSDENQFISASAFVGSFHHVLTKMITPNMKRVHCPNCGDGSNAIVCDGIAHTLQFRLYSQPYLNIYFNKPKHQKSPPVFSHGKIYNYSYPYSALAVLQGKLQEELLRLVDASQPGVHNGYYQMKNLHVEYSRQEFILFNEKIQIQASQPNTDNIRSISFLLSELYEQVQRDPLLPALLNLETNLLKTEQALIGCKSITKLQSPHGGAPLIYSFIALSMGREGSHKIPEFMYFIDSAEVWQFKLASAYVSGFQYHPIVANDEVQNQEIRTIFLQISIFIF